MAQRIFVYELPYSVRKSLCRILDATDKWEELGGEHMGFDYTYLQYIRRKDSPTDELLTSWGNQNHTVNDLFVLLSKMQHYRAMSLLKNLVHEQYHHLLKKGEELMSHLPSKTIVDQAYPNEPIQRPENNGHVCVEPEVSHAAAALPRTFEDNKDLGFELQNFNVVVQEPESKPTAKTINEVKIQNVADNRQNRNVDHNFNIHNNITTGQSQSQNLRLQMESPNTQIPEKERKLSNVSVTSSVMEGSTPLISYEELEAATNGWDTTCILGRGGFGTVYKGTWKNTLVAIKKLEMEKGQPMPVSDFNSSQIPQLFRELRSLNTHRHDNILSLYGYCNSESASCLVYQYMANGSLEDRLHCRQNSRPLNWAQRLNIMTGTARGIQFLHSLGKKPLVHGDIKSANILLDSNFEPRLGDFGLAREGPQQQYTHLKVSRVHGTRPYLPDEFLRGKQLSVKVDTYSFGVVLFEVATGLRAYDENRKERFLKDHIMSYPAEELSGLADRLAGRDFCSSAAGLLTLGRNCVATRHKDRPDMTIVLNNVDMLYNNYKGAERATSLARQRSLSPSNPLEIQVQHDELRNFSPYLTVQNSPQSFQLQDPISQQLLIRPMAQAFQIPLQQPFLFPNGLSPEAQCFAKGIGSVQVLHGNQTGMPQAIIVHHPPPTLAVQPSSIAYSKITSTPQADPAYGTPSPLDSSHIPLLTLLRVTPESDSVDNECTKVCSQASVGDQTTEGSHVSTQTSSSAQLHLSLNGATDGVETDLENKKQTHTSSQTSFSVSLPDESHSSYMPMIHDLLEVKPDNS